MFGSFKMFVILKMDRKRENSKTERKYKHLTKETRFTIVTNPVKPRSCDFLREINKCLGIYQTE